MTSNSGEHARCMWTQQVNHFADQANLSPNGYVLRNETRQDFKGCDAIAVIVCCHFLVGVDQRKAHTRSSYGLKHEVEEWTAQAHAGRWYVPNGALILAAILSEFRVERIPDSPNASIYCAVPRGRDRQLALHNKFCWESSDASP
ncbi:MAG: hypothetical protein HY273_04270 [Gammaproteobacteria bacterium]|nr:hypothetical protein [Gammaproteobacteria bacterium]